MSDIVPRLMHRDKAGCSNSKNDVILRVMRTERG